MNMETTHRTPYVQARANDLSDAVAIGEASVTITRTYAHGARPESVTFVLPDRASIQAVMNACEDALLLMDRKA